MHVQPYIVCFFPLQKALRVPSQVTGLSLSKAVRFGRPTLRVNWTAPQSEVPISRYEVQHRKNGTTFWGSMFTIYGSPPQTSTLLTGLEPGTEYNVRVRAVSTVGNGRWSVAQTGKTDRSEFFILYCNEYGPMVLMLVFWVSGNF